MSCVLNKETLSPPSLSAPQNVCHDLCFKRLLLEMMEKSDSFKTSQGVRQTDILIFLLYSMSSFVFVHSRYGDEMFKLPLSFSESIQPMSS